MVTTQWATPKRKEHLVKLFARHRNQCRQGHRACPDLRHHYERCAVEHVNVRTKELRLQLQQLDERERVSREQLNTRAAFMNPGYYRDLGERGRLQLLKRLHEELENELARMAEDCPDIKHYMEHVVRAMFDEEPIAVPLSLYKKMSEGAIQSWKAEDREEKAYLWKLEQKHINDGTFGRYGSDFDPVTRDIYYQERPIYYFLGFGVAAESKKRIAVVRVPSTYIRLYVEVSEAFEGASISRNKKRKMARYGSKPPAHIWEQVDSLCCQAVAAYWASR